MSAPAATYRPFYFVWVVVTVLCLLLALPLTIWDVSTHDHERTYIVWFVAGLFVLLAIPVSAYGVQVSCSRLTAHSKATSHPSLRATWRRTTRRGCRSTLSASCGCPACTG